MWKSAQLALPSGLPRIWLKSWVVFEEAEPRGPLKLQETAAINSRRSIYELRAAHSSETRQWCSPGSTAWTVVYEADPRFQLSCLNRFIYVKGVASLTDALHGADGCAPESLLLGWQRQRSNTSPGQRVGALGCDPDLSAGGNAKPHLYLASRWPSSPWRFGDLD